MDTKKDILNKAEKLFLSLGIRSVSMDDISRELGISKKTLYQYFENKDTLVQMVIDSHIEREHSEISQIPASSNDALDELNRIGLKLIQIIEAVSRSTLHDLQKYYRPSFDSYMKRQDGFIYECFFKNIKRGKEEGLFREEVNTEIVARIYIQSSHFVVDALSDPTFKYSRKEMVEELYNYHVRGIATPKGIRLWEKYRRQTKT